MNPRSAEIEDTVYYVGILNSNGIYNYEVFDRLTRYFSIWCYYKISNIIKINGILHYRFYGYAYPYPCEFFASTEKEIFEKKYNLR